MEGNQISNAITGKPELGSVIKFGKYDWRVLDIQSGQAFLLADKVTHTGLPYNDEWKDVTWESCTLRKWLNSDFLTNEFTPQEQALIAQQTIQNENNEWFGNDGGNETKDKIFLLSLSELMRYFGDSGQLFNRPSKATKYIIDQYNSARIAAKADGKPVWWWLRSSGIRRHAATVSTDGSVAVGGHRVDDGHAPGGVRPALILKLR